ncbi:MAG: sugar transferase, partial [Pseudomonadota bacterium]
MPETPPGMAEAAAAFLPHPWVDLGERSIVEPRLEFPATEALSPVRQAPEQTASHRADLAVKRALDVALATLALILMAPLLGFFALMLRAEGGPVFFAQTRIGRGRARFQCLKLRTMSLNAEEDLARLLHEDPVARAEWAVHQKLSRDPRITPLGRFLRETSL